MTLSPPLAGNEVEVFVLPSHADYAICEVAVVDVAV
jgi:hypothetical protein